MSVSSVDHVSGWEGLPSGEWLDNDEEGTHWYLGDDGRYWRSTDDGYRVWNEESSEPIESVTESASRTNFLDREEEEDEYADEDEDTEDQIPVPKIGKGIAFLGILVALMIAGWTLYLAIPATEENLELFGSESEYFVEQDRILVDGLESVQMLNTITLFFTGVIVCIGLLTMFKKTPWWGLSATYLGLFLLLFYTLYTAFSSEHNWVNSCDPQVVYCYQAEPASSLFTIDAFYTSTLCFVALMFVSNSSLRTWVDFDPNEQEVDEIPLIYIFGGDAPRLGGFASLLGLLMSISVIAFTKFIGMANTQDNIETSRDYGLTSLEESFASVQMFNTIALVLASIILVISLLSMIKKIPWWVLPSSCFTLLCLVLFTAQKSTDTGYSFVEQDAFYSGCCIMLAFFVMAISAFRSLSDFDWEELTDDDDDDYNKSSSKESFSFYDDDEEDGEERRGKVKIAVLVSLLLLSAFSGYAIFQIASDGSSVEAFAVRDAVGNITNGSDDMLVVVDFLDKTNAYKIDDIRISIAVSGASIYGEGENTICGGVAACGIDYLEVFDDGVLTAEESILVYENDYNLCSGEPGTACEITVYISYDDSQTDETVELAVLSIEAVSKSS